MPQVVAAGARLDSSLLESTGVYILDDFADIWVWTGRRSSRLVRAAAQKMCVNLKNMLPRPEYAVSLRITEVLALCHPVLSSCLFFYFWHAWYCLILFPPTPFRFFLCLCLTSLFWLPYFQGNEPQIFRSKFDRWDDAALVDHRPVELVALEQGKVASVSQPRINVNDMFLPPPAVDDQRMLELEEQGHQRVSVLKGGEENVFFPLLFSKLRVTSLEMIIDQITAPVTFIPHPLDTTVECFCN